MVSVVKKGEWKGALIQGGRCEESRRLILGCFTPEERVGRITVGGGGGGTYVSLPALAVKHAIMIATRPTLSPGGWVKIESLYRQSLGDGVRFSVLPGRNLSTSRSTIWRGGGGRCKQLIIMFPGLGGNGSTSSPPVGGRYFMYHPHPLSGTILV